MKLSKKCIEKLEIKAAKYFVMDDGLDNFGVKVYPSGKVSYIVRLRFQNLKKEHVIARAGDLTLVEAKDKARNIIKQYKKGIDVKAEELKSKSQDKTLKQCVKDYLPTVKKGTRASIDKANKIWEKEDWLKRPLKHITATMVLKLYDKRVNTSFHGARQEVAYLRAIWNDNKESLCLGESPTIILNKVRKGWNKKTTNHRRLDLETASKWFDAIQSLPTRDRQMFTLVYFTGMRASEAMGLEWSNIDFDNNSLHIPDTKNGLSLDIPLNTQSIKLLNSILIGEYKHKIYVFPQVRLKDEINDNTKKVITKKGTVEAMKYYSKSLTKLKAKGVYWSPHDSRRGYINAGAINQVSDFMTRQLTNHAENTADAHAGYNNFTLAELRPATQIIGDYLNNQLHESNIL